MVKDTNLIVILLLVANLIATVWFGVSNRSVTEIVHDEQNESELPKAITKEIRDELFKKIKNGFDQRDFESLYNIFGPAAKAQMSKQDVFQTLKRLVDYFDSIESGAYTNAEFLGKNGDTKNYTLNYAIKLSEKSKFGRRATLKITIVSRNNEFEIFGFKINAGA